MPLGIPLTDELVTIEPIPVAAHQVVTFSPDDLADLPAGRHAMVFSTGNQQSIVVEQAFTRTIDDRPTTAVLLGAPPRLADGYVATTWSVAIGPGEPTTDAFVVYNVDNADATVTVQTVTPDGIENVPSLAAVRPPGERAHHDRPHRAGRPRPAAHRALDLAGLRRPAPAPRARRPGTHQLLGRPRRRMSPMDRLLIAAAIVAVAVVGGARREATAA